jgi:hypothetical protein
MAGLDEQGMSAVPHPVPKMNNIELSANLEENFQHHKRGLVTLDE